MSIRNCAPIGLSYAGYSPAGKTRMFDYGYIEKNWDPKDPEGLKRYQEWKRGPIAIVGTIGSIPPIHLKEGAKVYAWPSPYERRDIREITLM